MTPGAPSRDGFGGRIAEPKGEVIVRYGLCVMRKWVWLPCESNDRRENAIDLDQVTAVIHGCVHLRIVFHNALYDT
jgi:hypothetical protein